MIIAVDFDGTIVEHAYPAIGKPIPFALDTLKQLQQDRHQLLLWTVREGALLQEAIDYCQSNGLYFYAHNANFPEEERSGAARKLKADLFIDDRNFGGLPHWGIIYQTIRKEITLDLGVLDAQVLVDQENKPEAKGWKRFFK